MARPLTPTNEPKNLNLFQRLVEIGHELRDMKKTGRNDFQKYDYFSEADILNGVKPYLKKHGVCLIPTVERWHTIDNNIVEVVIEITILNVNDKEDFKVIQWVGHGRDVDKNNNPMDKGLPKAITAAMKQAVGKIFLIAEGFDPEDEEQDYYTNDSNHNHNNQKEEQGRAVVAAEPKEDKASEKTDGAQPIERPMDYERIIQLIKEVTERDDLKGKPLEANTQKLKAIFKQVWGDASEEVEAILLLNFFGKEDLNELTSGENSFLRAFLVIDEKTGDLREEVDIEIGRCYDEWGYEETE